MLYYFYSTTDSAQIWVKVEFYKISIRNASRYLYKSLLWSRKLVKASHTRKS